MQFFKKWYTSEKWYRMVPVTAVFTHLSHDSILGCFDATLTVSDGQRSNSFRKLLFVIDLCKDEGNESCEKFPLATQITEKYLAQLWPHHTVDKRF